MARPRRGKRRRNQRDWLTDYLLTGIQPDSDDPTVNSFEVLDVCREESPVLRAAWEQSGIMKGWNKSGLRPFAWWLFDSPRLPLGTFPGRYIDGKLPEPRLRLSGPGRPLHEALAYSPNQFFGIWTWYGDPDNPPTFETQFEYLKRHGLLLPGEDQPLPETHVLPERIDDTEQWERRRKARNLPKPETRQ